MTTHYIVLGSSYFLGKRIALDYIDNDEFKSSMLKIFEICGHDVSISYHYLPTDSASWESVVEKDMFFEDVKLINSLNEFIDLLQKDRVLSGLDVAKYILSKIRCTHLKLEKLTYLCYAEYLCQTGKKIFDDKIYAFKYGPVIESVYEKCKGKYDYVSVEEEGVIYSNIAQLPSKSRIYVAESGFEKCVSIDDTLEKYGEFSAEELVEITHRPHSPWQETYKGLEYQVIDDEVILKFHKNEVV